MAITPQQKTAITAKLSVSLSTLADDKLIELCLLYRSAPEALPTFPTLLATEITRRFTAAEIAANDVMFSVIQNFSNQFNPELQYKEKLFEFVNALNRELWINQNITFFENLITVTDRVTWAVNNSDVMAAIAASSAAMTAIASSTAMTAVIASSVAMTAVAASSVALSVIVKSTSARNALMSSNTVFQNNRVAIYNTVKASWTKQAGVGESNSATTVNIKMNTVTVAVASPAGFVFTTIGLAGTGNSVQYGGYIKHPNSVEAVRIMGGNDKPSSINPVHGISFNGATVYSAGYASVYVELWSPA